MKNCITLFVLFLAFTVRAQTAHKFSIHVNGGLSTWNYKPVVGTATSGIGFGLGADYHFFFHPNWGISTGASASLYNSQYKLPALEEFYATKDKVGDIEFHYKTTNYTEKQQAILLNVPLMLRFEKGLFYASLGGKVGIPLHATYKSTIGELTAGGYLTHENVGLEELPFLGFSTYPNVKHNGTLKLQPAYFASVETGVKWTLTETTSLYTGVIVDYGLNDIRPTINKAATPQPLIPYNTESPTNYHPTSVIVAADAKSGNPYINKVQPLTVGVKVSLTFGKPAKKGSKKSIPQRQKLTKSDLTKIPASVDTLQTPAHITTESAATEEALRQLTEDVGYLRYEIDKMREEARERERQKEEEKAQTQKQAQATKIQKVAETTESIEVPPSVEKQESSEFPSFPDPTEKNEDSERTKLLKIIKEAESQPIQPVKKKAKMGRYHIIVGSFKNEELAAEALRAFRRRGYTETRIMLNSEKGLYRVVLMSLQTIGEARRKVAEIKQRGNPAYRGIWILEE
ncbi:hypothetical protein FACS1894199_15130 [Bacteroidia bacterium]|nr:hypothetical protein FACS1894199_15130 [Bacteroidia bacterium]